MIVVGVDCATVNRRTGLAFAFYHDGRLDVEECSVARPEVPVAEQIFRRLTFPGSVLLALDSPLGWPAALGAHLARHRAGKEIPVDADVLFRRRTDQVVRETLGKVPLEVGANFIARTAVTALRVLHELSQLAEREVELAWRAPRGDQIAAIEVCPAGTVRSYQRQAIIPQGGDAIDNKRALLTNQEQAGRLHFRPGVTNAPLNEHALDSILCCLAALDFLEGKAMAPGKEYLEQVEQEGWIWVRDPENRGTRVDSDGIADAVRVARDGARRGSR